MIIPPCTKQLHDTLIKANEFGHITPILSLPNWVATPSGSHFKLLLFCGLGRTSDLKFHHKHSDDSDGYLIIVKINLQYVAGQAFPALFYFCGINELAPSQNKVLDKRL